VVAPVRFRFAAFVLSPRQRVLSRNGVAIALIPRYFDLLLLLVSRRHEAVSKQTIFDHVWKDVVVSDGALSQAVRTLRRTLGDDSREPRFIRTVSRHGYQFVWPDVIEETDDGHVAVAAAPVVTQPSTEIESLVDRLLELAPAGSAHEEARDVAERLHAIGTREAMARITARPGHAAAVAIMRDARWNVPGAGAVPLLRDSEAVPAIAAVVRLRVAAVKRTIARRWAGAAASGAVGGAVAGMVGGIVLTLSPASTARAHAALALAAIGVLASGVGAGGIAAGLAAAEVLSRASRGVALVVFGALSGSLTAGVADVILRALLDSLFGVQLLHANSAIDGLVIGAAAGAGYALTTSQPPGGGIAAPRGTRRLTTVMVVGICCAAAAVALASVGRPLIGGLVHDLAQASRGAQLGLAPLGRLIGEPDFGPISRLLLSAFEGGIFGCSLAWGFTGRSGRPGRGDNTEIGEVEEKRHREIGEVKEKREQGDQGDQGD
jgi:DNA-binding winged helix-turn-helix (wHTH) protein